MTEKEKKKKFFEDRISDETEEVKTKDEGVAEEPIDAAADAETKEENASVSETDELKNQIERLKKENEEVKNDYLRARADCENVRKRKSEEIRAAYDDGRKSAIEKMLPIGDSLDWALKMNLDDNTRDGIEKLLKKYHETLTSLGVEEFSPEVGSKFDPNTANAVMTVPKDGDEEADTIKQVFGRGYKLGDKVMRYAQVSVVKE